MISRSAFVRNLAIALLVGLSAYMIRNVLRTKEAPTNVGTIGSNLYRLYTREALPPITVSEFWFEQADEWHYRAEHFVKWGIDKPGTSIPAATSVPPAQMAIQWILTEYSVQQSCLTVVAIRRLGGNDAMTGLTEVAVEQRVDGMPAGVSFVTCSNECVEHAVMKLYKYTSVSSRYYTIIDPETEFGDGGPALLPQYLILGASMEYGKISGITYEAYGPFWNCRSYERGANRLFAFEAIRDDSLIELQRRSLLEQSSTQ